MHEAGIAQAIIDTLEARLEAGEIEGRICTVCLQIGRLTAVVPENLEFLFGVLAQRTPLEGARLAIQTLPIRGRCPACGAEVEVEEVDFVCRSCGAGALELCGGMELQIDAVEVE